MWRMMTIALLVVLASSAVCFAVAEWHLNSGTACVGLDNASQSLTRRGNDGITNGSTSSNVTVVCPVQWECGGCGTSFTADDVRVHYYDRNANVVLSCYIEGIDYFGNWNLSPSKYSCSTGGGCDDPASGATYGAPGLPANYLDWFWAATDDWVSVDVRCVIPYKSSPSGTAYSYVTSYRVNLFQ